LAALAAARAASSAALWASASAWRRGATHANSIQLFRRSGVSWHWVGTGAYRHVNSHNLGIKQLRIAWSSWGSDNAMSAVMLGR
jgi:hypothetical protein